MKYRKFGKLDWKVSPLGFGCMRLPLKGKKQSDIDETETIKMIRYAIDRGVNYIDTAYPYHGGNSEIVVGNALKDGYREKVRLATKLPCWMVNEKKDIDRFLDEQLKKLQTDYIDFYLLHALNKKLWNNMQKFNILEWGERVRNSGKIKYFGFSFHDTFEVFKEIVDTNENWDFCQIQYNYLDINNQAGSRGLRYAAEKELAVVIMEPLLGGRLAHPPHEIQKIWNLAKNNKPAVKWALDWLWDQPEISVVLSGMTTMEQVIENVKYAENSNEKYLSPDELEIYENVRIKYNDLCPIPCTKCEYCLPCENGLPIPQLFDIYNKAVMHDDIEGAQKEYSFIENEKKAINCAHCRKCEELCPQKISISEWMTRVHELLHENKSL